MGRKSLTGLILSISFVFLFPSSVCAAYEIYAYGSGDFLAAIFNGIAMLASSGMITGLVKIALILVLLYILLGPVMSSLGGKAVQGVGQFHGGEGLIAMITVAITAAIAMAVFLGPKTEVAIIDKVDPSQSQIVANVPFPNAVIAHMMSSVGDVIGREFETVFSLPDTLQFRNGGVALGAKYTDSLTDIYPPSSSTTDLPSYAHLITQSLREYYVKCVFPNFASLDGTAGPKTTALDALFTTPDMMTQLKDPLYRDVNTIILAPNDTGEATCDEAIDLIDNMWNTQYPAWEKDIETKLSANAGVSGVSGSTTINIGSGILTQDIISRYFSASTVDTRTVLKNIAAINLLRDSVQSYLMWNGVPSASAYSVAKRTTVSGLLTAARFFNALVHTMRNIFEGLIYGFSVFLPVAVVLAGPRALVTYGKIALWLQLWVPFYVILNLYADIEIRRVLSNLFITQVAKSPTMVTLDKIAEQVELTLGYIGSLAPLVPTLAWAVVSGGAYAITRGVASIVAVTGTASAVGGEVVGKGNLAMGNKSFANESFGGSSVISSQYAFTKGITDFSALKNWSDRTGQSGSDILKSAGIMGHGGGAMLPALAGAAAGGDKIGLVAQKQGIIKIATPGGPTSVTYDPESNRIVQIEDRVGPAEIITRDGVVKSARNQNLEGKINESVGASFGSSISNAQSQGENFTKQAGTEWNKAENIIKSSSITKGSAASSSLTNIRATETQSGVNSAITEALGRVEGIKDTKGWKTISEFLGSAEVGGRFRVLGVGAGAKGRLNIKSQTNRGTETTLSLDSKHARQFASNLQKTTSDRAATAKTQEEREAYQRLSSYAEQVGRAMSYSEKASESFSRAKELREQESQVMQSLTSSGIDFQTDFHKWAAKGMFGNDGREAVIGASKVVNDMVATGRFKELGDLFREYTGSKGIVPSMRGKLPRPEGSPVDAGSAIQKGQTEAGAIQRSIDSGKGIAGAVSDHTGGGVPGPTDRPETGKIEEPTSMDGLKKEWEAKYKDSSRHMPDNPLSKGFNALKSLLGGRGSPTAGEMDKEVNRKPGGASRNW